MPENSCYINFDKCIMIHSCGSKDISDQKLIQLEPLWNYWDARYKANCGMQKMPNITNFPYLGKNYP